MATIGSTGQMVIGQSQKERTVMVSFKNNIQHGIMILDLIIVYFIHILLSYKTGQMDKTQVVILWSVLQLIKNITDFCRIL